MSDKLPDRSNDPIIERVSNEGKTIAKFSAEQTARFLAGGELGRPEYTNPQMQAKMDRQREALRVALADSVQHFKKALVQDSAQTARRLDELADAMFAGNEEATRLFLAMYGELIVQAVRP